MKQLKQLGEAELDIMHVIWSSALPVRASYVSQQLKGKRNWQLSSIMTVLSRLVTKGFLAVEKIDGWNLYSAQVSEQEYQMSEGAKLLKNLHAGSVKSLVASLVGGESVSQEELEDLRKYLDEGQAVFFMPSRRRKVMPIACPHFKITIRQRSKQQSAVAGAAYQSGEKLFSEYDLKTKNYRYKSPEVMHKEILLPSHAPPEYQDRQTLWNAAEKIEKQWNAQLSRGIILTLPRELSMEQNISLIRDYCMEQFVSKCDMIDIVNI